MKERVPNKVMQEMHGIIPRVYVGDDVYYMSDVVGDRIVFYMMLSEKGKKIVRRKAFFVRLKHLFLHGPSGLRILNEELEKEMAQKKAELSMSVDNFEKYLEARDFNRGLKQANAVKHALEKEGK